MERNPVGWFEIPVLDLPRAKAFYESVLGITLDAPITEGGYEMSFFPGAMEDKKGSSGALSKGEQSVPGASGVMIYFTCLDIEDACVRAEAAGGKVVTPLTDIGQYGQMALVGDTEGNTVGLHRMQEGSAS